MPSQKTINAMLSEISLAEEMDVDLGDPRRTSRVKKICEALAATPCESFPEVFDKGDDCEAFYRFLRNKKVNFNDLLEGHIEQTVSRAQKLEQVVVIHDTTEFRFPIHNETLRPGLCKFSSKKQGFFGHGSLVASADGVRCPLGLVGFRPFARQSQLIVDKREPNFWGEVNGLLASEYDRWLQEVEAAEQRLHNVGTVIHLMDREADSFEIVATMKKKGQRFVIRLAQERKVRSSKDDDDQSYEFISDILARQPVLCSRTVDLSPRYDGNRHLSARKGHPARRQRQALLSVRACAVRVPQPTNPKKNLSHLPKEIAVNVVEVFEKNPPEDEPAVRWLLVTTEPIDTIKDVFHILDLYRTRWLIEEFFKSLKTGCAYRTRQLNSARTLLCALALLLPVAWKLLVMRHLERTAKDAPADCLVNDLQLKILRNNYPKLTWSKKVTMGQVMAAIAKLGGHRKSNGAPGWLIIGRGYAKLLNMEAGARLMLGELGNQS